MKKIAKKTFLIFTFSLFIFAMVACAPKEAKEIPLTDLAATYEGEATDENGNLLAPFDVVYPEAFNSGEYEYDEDNILLKMSKSFNGKLSNNLANCGLVKIVKFMSGEDSDWYRATIENDTDVKTAIMKVRSLSEVLVADYDYIYQNETVEDNWETVGPSIDCKDRVHEPVRKNEHVGKQWYLTSGGIQQAWSYLEENGIAAGGSSSVTVAVIDTGVDYNHPDLLANMWTNTAEIAGNGKDDDNNGYIDDIHGVNVVANNGYGDTENIGNPMDDHGHGTHVAGIIAASNNNAGIVGIAYNAKIMAVKAGQATGIFLQSDIAEGILYAYQMGADVINMSFGGSACSIAVQDALTQAYTTATLVASAGNDGMPNEPTDEYQIPLPNYPAALNYVIGVMSVDYRGVESSFSNWDVKKYNTVEYELYAPGQEIISTLPGERYGKLSGTSMAAPMVSGIAALLRSYFTDRDKYPSKFIAAQLAATSETTAACFDPKDHAVAGMPHNLPMIVNAYTALTKLPKPEVTLYNYYLFDDEDLSEKNNGDGVMDAGETVNIAPVLRNRWGMSKDTIITIDAVTNDDLGLTNPYVEIITGSLNYDSVGTYSTKDKLVRNGSIVTDCEMPFVIKIADNCPNDYLIKLNVTISCENALNDKDNNTYTTNSEISFVVRNGVILPSQITEDMTLTKDNYYIIPNSTYIAEGVTVTVEEGTQIQFWSDDPKDPYADTYIAYLNVAGNFITKGTVEEPVLLFPSDMMGSYVVEIMKTDTGYVDLEYTTVTNPLIKIDYANHCTFNQNYENSLCIRYLSGGKVETDCWFTPNMVNGTQIENSLFYKLSGPNYLYKAYVSGNFNSCIFMDCALNSIPNSSNCVFMGNEIANKNFAGVLLASKLSFTDIVKNNETGTTYMVISHLHYNGWEYNGVEQLIVDFAESLGGHIACIETEEEFDYLRNVYRYGDYRLGIDKNSDKWYNGELFDLSMEIRDDGGQYVCLYSTDLVYHNSSDYLIEIPGEIYCNNISVNDPTVNIDTETQYKVNVSVNPITFDTSKLIYVSSDNSVATVDENGVVTPIREGEVTIYVYSPDYNVKTECNINIVEKVPLKSFDIVSDSTQIEVGEYKQLEIDFYPSNTTEKYVTYSSSDPSIISVDANGLIKANKVGDAIITITAKDIVKTVEFSAVKGVESINFKDTFYVTYSGDNDSSWMPTILPVDATNKKINWASSNPEVAYVDENNNLIRVSVGNATIRATIDQTDLFAELNISVTESKIDNTAKVIQMDYMNGLVIAVMDDNTLWVWGGDKVKTPIKIMDNVQSAIITRKDENFCWCHNDNQSHYHEFFEFYAIDMNGTLSNYRFCYEFFSSTKVELSFSISNVKKLFKVVGWSGDSFYALKNDGSVWAWGSNDCGQLGDGTKVDKSTPVQMQVEGVVDVAPLSSACAILDENGDLYMYGGNQSFTEKYLVAENVSSVCSNGSCLSLKEINGLNYYINTWGDLEKHELDINKEWYGIHWGVEDGVLYNIYSNSGIDCSSIKNVKKVFAIDESLAFFITEDNQLYGVGRNNYGELADLTNTFAETPKKIAIGLKNTNYIPSIENQNVNDGLLINETLNLDFDCSIMKGNDFGTISLVNSCGDSLSVVRELCLDKFSIRPFGGFKQGETYTLTIPANALTSVYGASNEKIIYTFEYQNNTQIEFVSSNIDDNAVFEEQEFNAEFNYSFATEGDAFDSISLTKEGSSVDGVSISLANSTLTFDATLEYGDYCLVIPEGALKDNVGGTNEEIVVNFTIAEVIKLLDSSITNGEDRVSESDNISLTFTEAVEGELYEDIKLIDSKETIIEINKEISEGVLTIVHNGLIQGMSYTLMVPKGALKDALGNTNNEIIINFTTYNQIEMLYSSIGENDIALSPEFKLYYNSDNILDESKVNLYQGENLVEINAELDGRILRINPLEQLLTNTEYTIRLEEGALLDERNALSSLYEKTFTTINITKRFYWNFDELNERYEPWKYHNGRFYNNAILNNFNDTNVEHWLRLQADSYSSKIEIGAAGNFWGTTDIEMINKQIVDFDDYQSLGDIVVGEYLQVAPENTFPFVTNITLFNSNGEEVTTVSNETVKFVVEFNRDMDTTVPLRLRFGSSTPYAEYEIPGKYVSPRKWEGTYTLSTTIENGNQYFNISNGRAADDHYLGLYETLGRFTFEIDTAAAQAMIMQAEANEEGVKLIWVQDDFETLAGYNVYRSNQEDGYYQRLNDYVLSSDTKEFLDDTVEPGKLYYYNFTVVKTDLTESTPSGKVAIYSLDTMAPNIYHSPVRTAYTGSNLLVTATITDNLQITSAKLYYRTVGSETWKSVQMSMLNNRYTGLVLSDYISIDGLEYYIEAFDGISHTYKGSEETPYLVTVKLAVDKNSMGDVDGDGNITAKDALMLLQAANDQLNLSEEQFKRADLNEDGILSASEALKILQYVSGKISSVLE